MKEIWKDIKGYEGIYQVSNIGRVKSLAREVKSTGAAGNYFIEERIRKPQIMNKGYYALGLRKNGKVKRFFVHRLVAEAFVPNPNNYPIVNHKDECKTNNNYDNLEWCTISYNNEYGTRIERQKKTRKDNIENNKKIRCITTGKEFGTLLEAAKYYNCRIDTDMSKIVKGIRKYCGKLQDGTLLEWEYIKRDDES